MKSLTASILLLFMVVFIPAYWLEGFLVEEKVLEQADAIIVMAGNPDQRLPPAARLYHEGKAPKILLTNDGVFSAWSRKHQRNLYQVEWALEDLLKKGVPEEDIVMLNYTDSGSIRDVLNTRAYVLGRDDIESLLVVTSDYHTRRTLWTFMHVFADDDLEIGIYPVLSSSNNIIEEFRNFYLEFTKYIYYRLRYGLFSLSNILNLEL